jgi:Flp pilus assembly protein TadB
MARRATLRASDADREQAAARLRQASTEGRLAADELEQRLGAALSARTYGELDSVLSDLPVPASDTRRSAGEHGWVRPAVALTIAVPVALAVVAAVVLAATGVIAMWVLWVAVGWWFFGRRRRSYGARHVRSSRACGPWRASDPRLHSSRGFWV